MNNLTVEQKQKIRRKRKVIDNTYKSMTLLASTVGVISLIAIFVYVFVKGSSLISLDLILGDYYSSEYHISILPDEFCNCDTPNNLPDGAIYSEKWGIAIAVTQDSAGLDIVTIVYIDDNSPFYQAENIYDDSEIYMKTGLEINTIQFTDNTITIARQGIETIMTNLDSHDGIKELYVSGEGGGIRGSLISTLYLIFFSLLFALPLGIFTAIYLNEYAKGGGFVTRQLRQLIEMLTGVPSIIFGLVGLVVFIPITTAFGFTGKNIIAASLTLTIIILPTIIRSTEESLKVIPNDLRQASLALGANKTQTTFKVVLPNALPGILTATLLGIGRVIGESAALIFVLGTIINDHVTLDSASTSLAVQIWSIMGGEVANFELASAISIIILCVVLIMNLTVKLITYRLNKAWH